MKETISGQVERISFQNSDNGYAVIQLKVANQPMITAVGCLNNPIAGEFLNLTGEFATHPRYGLRFKVDSYTQKPPTTTSGLIKYLGSGLIKGIGPVLAERMVKLFGTDVLDILETKPNRLTEVPGLGKAKQEKIIAAWQSSIGLKRLLTFLAQFGLGPSLGSKILKRLGPNAEQIIRTDPYLLAYEINGVGFVNADKVAKNLGFADDAPERQDAALLYTLSQATKNGHDFLPSQELYQEIRKIISDLDPVDFQTSLNRVTMCGKIVAESQTKTGLDIYLPKLHRAEIWVAKNLVSLISTPFSTPIPRPENALKWVEKELALNLSEDQRLAVLGAITKKVIIVTGGPGTGKTTMTRAVYRIWQAVTNKIALVAPTGRAAKRLGQATGFQATTIHRLLEYSPTAGGFIRGPNFKLKLDMLLIDEASMLDINLANSILGAIPANCALIIVGDRDQLPPVGPGQVLGDLIDSGEIPVHRLGHIFRQAQKSQIITAAHGINRGLSPENLAFGPDSDFHFVKEDDPERIKDKIVKLISERIPKKLRLNPVTDIQVLSPTRQGELGTLALNNLLSPILNPDPGPELLRFGQIFKKGERVMQTKNNYNLDVYNGDLGLVSRIDISENELEVDYEGKIVTYDFTELDELIPAWAITVHKSQGSEFPAIIMPLTTSHHIMLRRKLLYTAVTRGRRMVFLVGSIAALKKATATDHEATRHSHLADFLKSPH